MSVGLLIMSHNGVGPAMLGTASMMMEACPLKAKLLTASRDSNPDEILDNAKALVQELNEGDGVLILIDLFGSTPSNVAQLLLQYRDVRIVTGLNLSMLIRVLNYPSLGIDELTEKALSGGKEGILLVKKK